MKLLRKKKVSTVALVLVLTFVATFVAVPDATAQEPSRKKTFAFIGAVPNPVGVGQTVLLHLGIFTATKGKGYGWEGLTVTVTKPDGTTDTLGPYTTDSTGGTGATYTPDATGTYYLQSHFPEQEAPVTWFDMERLELILEGTVFEASDSEELELVVQEEPVEYYPGVPLPAEYWTRPIDSQLREWHTIAGNWLWPPLNLFAPYNDLAPESAHILWTKPLDTGGLVGGEFGEYGYFIGDAYEGEWPSAVIINGILYYNKFSSMVYDGDLYEPTYYAPPGVHAVDLRTGEEIWYNPDIRISFGQIYYYSSPNQHGAFAYLWETVGSTWRAYDPYTGDWIYTIENAPTGFAVMFGIPWMFGPDGEILVPVVDTINGWMALWNSSAIPKLLGGGTGAATWMWRPWGKTVDGRNGYSWNVTIPAGLPGSVQAIADDRVLGFDISPTRDRVTFWALSLEPGNEGTLLFNKTWTPPAEWAEGLVVIQYSGATSHGEGGVFGLWCKELRKHYGFSFDTGEFLWETDSEIYLDIYGWGKAEHEWLYVYDRLYSVGVGGILYCYDLNTGDTLWEYHVEDPYQEYLFANDWWQRITFITDGKVYMGHAEHSPMDPKPRGGPFCCVNATSGEEIWRADGLFRQTHWGGRGIIGDSIMVTMDTYDQRIYAVGRGPSATEVSASPKIIEKGASVLIEGRVTDQSPGAKGTPAIADEFMSEWMLYVYKQFPAPMDVTGVPVLLQAMSSNGTITDLDWVTSDGCGCFSFMWTPPDEDVYTIMATFMGSNSYWPSYAQTALGVGPAPPEAPEKEEAEAPAYSTIDLVIIAAVVVVAILVIYTLYTVRKQRK